MSPPTLDAMLDWLYGAQLFGVKLGLENTRRLLAALPRPNSRLTIHVAGTNGKGSVCAFLDSLLRALGRRVGLFTSPHLIHFRERIRVDGEAVTDDHLLGHLLALRDLVSSWNPHPTFFELSLAAAWRHFERAGVDALVLETGMGGRLDATNAVEPVHCSVITSVALDHTAHLGGTLERIAVEKAGIIKPGAPVVCAPQPPEVRRVIQARAAELGSPLRLVDEPCSWPLGLAGEHQKTNASLALAALAAAGAALGPEPARAALAGTVWPGRFQRCQKGRVVIDGAHNPHAAEALARTWRTEYPDEKALVIFGAAKDKDLSGTLSALTPIAERFVFCPIQSPRSAFPRGMPSVGVPSQSANSLAEALRVAQASSARTLIAGSLFLAGEALALLSGKPKTRSETQ